MVPSFGSCFVVTAGPDAWVTAGWLVALVEAAGAAECAVPEPALTAKRAAPPATASAAAPTANPEVLFISCSRVQSPAPWRDVGRIYERTRPRDRVTLDTNPPTAPGRRTAGGARHSYTRPFGRIPSCRVGFGRPSRRRRLHQALRAPRVRAGAHRRRRSRPRRGHRPGGADASMAARPGLRPASGVGGDLAPHHHAQPCRASSVPRRWLTSTDAPTAGWSSRNSRMPRTRCFCWRPKRNRLPGSQDASSPVWARSAGLAGMPAHASPLWPPLSSLWASP